MRSQSRIWVLWFSTIKIDLLSGKTLPSSFYQLSLDLASVTCCGTSERPNNVSVSVFRLFRRFWQFRHRNMPAETPKTKKFRTKPNNFGRKSNIHWNIFQSFGKKSVSIEHYCVTDLNLRHLAVERGEEEREDVAVQVVLRGLFQHDGQALQQRHGRLRREGSSGLSRQLQLGMSVLRHTVMHSYFHWNIALPARLCLGRRESGRMGITMGTRAENPNPKSTKHSLGADA